MALTFGAASSDRVEHAAATNINNLSTWTTCGWWYPTSLNSFRHYWSKRSGFDGRFMYVEDSGGYGADEIVCQQTLSSGPDSWTTSGAGITVNKWWFIAATYDFSATDLKIYVGDLTTVAAETAYNVTGSASGTLADDSAGPFKAGQRHNDTGAWQGRIDHIHHLNRVLSLGEIRAQQFRPHAVSGSVLFTFYGYNGIGTQPDWSGGGNAGTVTGATVSDGAPLPPPFGFDIPWQSVAASSNAYDLVVAPGSFSLTG